MTGADRTVYGLILLSLLVYSSWLHGRVVDDPTEVLCFQDRLRAYYLAKGAALRARLQCRRNPTVIHDAMIAGGDRAKVLLSSCRSRTTMSRQVDPAFGPGWRDPFRGVADIAAVDPPDGRRFPRTRKWCSRHAGLTARAMVWRDGRAAVVAARPISGKKTSPWERRAAGWFDVRREGDLAHRPMAATMEYCRLTVCLRR